MADEQPDSEVQDLLSHTSGQGVPSSEPEGQPEASTPELPLSSSERPAGAAAAPQTTPAGQPPAWEQSPLAPLVQRLPGGLRRAVASGQMSYEEAVSRHFQGYVKNVDRVNQENRQLREQNQQAVARFERMMAKFQETLGIDLEEKPEEQPADPLRDVHGKLDQVLQLEEERRIETTVDQVQDWANRDREQVLQEHPYLPEAEGFLAERLLDKERQNAQDALTWFNATKDPRHLQGFEPAYLRAVVNGEMDEVDLIERTAVERTMDAVAVIQHRHFQGRTSIAAEVLEMAQRLGWQPGSYQAQGAQPQPAPATPSGARPQPAPARRDPALDRVRQNMAHQPQPAGGGSAGMDAAQAAQTIANMDQATFDLMMANAENPAAMLKHIQKLAAQL